MKMKKVIVFGTFDIIHSGHRNLFKQAREFGDYLIVVAARDKTVLKVKGKLPVNNEKTRLNNIIKSNLADKAVLGDLKNKYKKIKEFKPDVICLGYDQKNFTEGLSSLDVKVVKLKAYKPNIYKSSKIKEHKTKIKEHKSVGAIIRKNNKILMIDRKIYPFGWACPAGHIDSGETAAKALKREVKEETGLEVLKYKLLIHEFVDWNKCNRGVKGHDWCVYEVFEWEGRVRQNKREEKKIGWINIKKIKSLGLEKVWEHWFEKLNII